RRSSGSSPLLSNGLPLRGRSRRSPLLGGVRTCVVACCVGLGHRQQTACGEGADGGGLRQPAGLARCGVTHVLLLGLTLMVRAAGTNLIVVGPFNRSLVVGAPPRRSDRLHP